MKIVMLVLLLAQFQHGSHPEVLPTDPMTWMSCCHDHDCMEASIAAQKLATGNYQVSVAHFPAFYASADKVRPSQNGKSYFCTRGAQIPPTRDNILCVFIAQAPQV